MFWTDPRRRPPPSPTSRRERLAAAIRMTTHAPPKYPSRFGVEALALDLHDFCRREGFRAPIWSLHPDDWESFVTEFSDITPVLVMYDHANMAGVRFQDCVVVRAVVPPYSPQP